ncbi:MULTISPECIES: sensor histidine kinase [unclassified Coleofasciculus]|uniref:sensor histidine kinase n=1 Tax=unclassified Coleofasciculus TaxID=2692782 RepID=UPI001880207F|nr:MULTISPECIES: HAMP domain-containing sensor histidine kinase [unclassified Coleofasciculus]MBE9126173.1 two-component sensor histidine kinase [Coleofasciculus sp. LEGE 07081]MBE9149620.1 two-component sensor histidine kinase [Coleofasciculus sp. LEGE 07092]
MFQNLRWRLLLSYLMVMAAILSIFGTGVYIFVSRNLYRQLDKKLLTLAQAAAPSFTDVEIKGSRYLEQVDAVPWRDIFNRDQQSLEWFDAKGKLLASRGTLDLNFRLSVGSQTLERWQKPKQIRIYTISVFKDGSNPNQPNLEGYIRASQSTEDIETVQSQMLWGLGMGGMMALGLVSLGGLWLSQKAIEPIEQSFQQLKQFTADASHELRSPLTAIKASVDVMRNHPERIHPKDAKKLAAIASATAQMSHLTEDLLFLARTDGTVSTPVRDRIPIPLNKILQHLVELLEPFAQDKDVALQSQWFANLSVMGDETQLTRLFSNLLENALQYTPPGGKVILTLAKHNRFALVSIKDTGIGIEREHLPFVFDRFWRADKARSRREGGTGLGLAIAQAIAQRHGGKITVTSQVGCGSCFQIRLPTV